MQVLRLEPEAIMPIRAYDESAGWDLSAFCLSKEERRPLTIVVAPQTTRVIRTGLALRPPPGHCILVCSRSGLATSSLFVANAPGVVDPNYTGEIKVLMYNGGQAPYFLKHADRIAQALFVPFAAAGDLIEVKHFPETKRGAKGLGSTGA